LVHRLIFLGVDASHVHLPFGSIDNPSIHFGLIGSDHDTGFYRVGSNAIGVSCSGELVASFWNHHAPTTGFASPGFNVGVSAAIGGFTDNICAIKRISYDPVNSWEDGHWGNSQKLYFNFTDFVGSGRNAIYSATASGTRPASVAGLLLPFAYVASRIMPVGFRVAVDASVNILTFHGGAIPDFGSSSGTMMGKFEVSMDTYSESGMGVTHTDISPIHALTMPGNTNYSLQNIPSTFTGTGMPAGNNIIVININCNPDPTFAPGAGIVGAYIHISRII